jgi:hypothetical protein
MKCFKGTNRTVIYSAFLFTMLMLSVATSATAQTGSVNFAGTWAFNESKSGQAEFRMAPNLMTVTQDGNILTVESSRPNMDGENVKSTVKYTLDGKECTNPAGFGNSTRKSVVTWSADGKSLNFVHTMKFDRDGETTEFKTSEVWKMNADKTLSVETSMNFQGQDNKTVNVYDKK